MNNTFLSRLEWRFATKKFDAAKKLTSEQMTELLRAIRMAPTSYGVQPFHVVIVTDPELRKALCAASYDQSQVSDASHLLVFCARTDLTARIDQYFESMTGGIADAMLATKGYASMMHGALDAYTGDVAWAAKQAYIALGFGLAAAAELGIDSCPMEGFDPVQVDKILGLPAHFRSVAFMAVGSRAAEPESPKFRFDEKDLFEYR